METIQNQNILHLAKQIVALKSELAECKNNQKGGTMPNATNKEILTIKNKYNVVTHFNDGTITIKDYEPEKKMTYNEFIVKVVKEGKVLADSKIYSDLIKSHELLTKKLQEIEAKENSWNNVLDTVRKAAYVAM
ncbi:hypothetical protein IOU64_004441 [Salmonella enterica]|nr:hypothetical protein [Salmonella enterica]